MLNTQNIQTNPHQCNQCNRKTSLINKYLHLIQLLKKKNQKTNKSTTIISHKNSIIDGPTLSATPSDLLSQSYHRYKFIQVLNKLSHKRLMNAFKQIVKQPKNVNLALLLIVNKYNKVLRYEVFNNLKRAVFYKEDQRKLEEFERTQKIKEQIQFESIQTVKHDTQLKKLKATIKIMDQNLKKVNTVMNNNSNFANINRFQTSLLKENNSLKVQQKQLKLKIQYLQKELEQNVRRQYKQSQKKKQSLQMLAEDISEKNQMIIQLQNIVKSYQCRINKSNAVLQDQYQTMRKQVEQLQKINQKLQFDMIKFRDKSTNLSQKIIEYQTKYQSSLQQNQKLKYKIFDLRRAQQQNQGSLKQAKQIIVSFKEKMSELKIKENQVNERIKKITQAQRQIISLQQKQMEYDSRRKVQNILQQIPQQLERPIKSIKSASLQQIDCQSKIFAIFSFLKALTSSHKQISQENDKCVSSALKRLLSEEQEKIMNDHMKVFKQNHNISSIVKEAIQQKQNIESQRKKIKVSKTQQNFFNKNQKSDLNQISLAQSDEIIHGQKDIFDSILDVMDNNNQLKKQYQELQLMSKPKNKDNSDHLEDLQYPGSDVISKDFNTVRRQPKQNLTLKLLQMELQKNSLVQKISDLKNKYLHIRNMVFNLLKSIKLSQINLSNRNQTLGVLQVIFNVFEYSEQQKQEIFSANKKKKKFFNLFQ